MLAKAICTGLAICLGIVFASCSRGPAQGTVNGEVTLDDQPLKKGHVNFEAVDGSSPTTGAMIEEGKFTAQVPTGQMKVMLHATKVVGKRKLYDTPEAPWEDEVAELLPGRYNLNSDLKLDVKRGEQNVKYELKSK
jgi:hypothetical protein